MVCWPRASLLSVSLSLILGLASAAAAHPTTAVQKQPLGGGHDFEGGESGGQLSDNQSYTLVLYSEAV